MIINPHQFLSFVILIYNMTDSFTDEEAKVYDRQIRLWGIHAQQKIRSADVLVIGLTGLATEVVKNLVLAGINSITLIDDKLVTDFDMLSNLFTRNQVGKNRAEAIQKYVQELNPMVIVKIKNISLTDILLDEDGAKSFIKQFHVVVLVNHSSQSIIELNKICNYSNVPFFSACAWGFFSMVFCDLGKNFNGIRFVPFNEVLSSKSFNLNSNLNVRRAKTYKSIFLVFLTLFKFYEKNKTFPEILNEDNREELVANLQSLEREILEELNAHGNQSWTIFDGWHSKVFGQFSFISSIVGGLLAQDIIRSVTKDNIVTNFFFFDGLKGFNLNIGI